MIDFKALLTALDHAGVRFILVGGVAATVHGSSRLTKDVDVVYARDGENISRLSAALRPHAPYLRGAPPGLPFRWDEETIRRGLNLTLATALGPIDLLGEIAGGGRFVDLEPHSVRVSAYGVECLCLGLDKLIDVKRAAGRPQDLDAIAELEILRDERDRG